MTLLPTVRTQLVDAVQRADSPRRRWRPEFISTAPGARRQSRDRLIMTALVALTLAIVAGALAVLHVHRTPHVTPAAVPPVPTVPGVRRARQELVSHFAVLRTAQTPADRDPQLIDPFLAGRLGQQQAMQQQLKRLGSPRLDRELMRVVPVPVFNAEVAFEPTTWAPVASSGRRSEGLNITMRIGVAKTIPPSQQFGSGPRPTSVGTVLDDGLAASDGRIGNRLAGVVAVPDGVARVRLRVTGVDRAPDGVTPAAFGTADTAVAHNLAPFELPIPRIFDRRVRGTELMGLSATAHATWVDADGKVIRQTTTPLDVMLRLHGNAPPR